MIHLGFGPFPFEVALDALVIGFLNDGSASRK
jgi:hypothetical protein